MWAYGSAFAFICLVLGLSCESASAQAPVQVADPQEVQQQATKRLTNSDIAGMVKAGLAESTILLVIRQSPTEFDTSPAALVALESQGVAPTILNAMQSKQGIDVRRPDSAPQVSQTPTIEPFGFRAGMTKGQVVAAVGSVAVKRDDEDVLVLLKAPKPHSDFVEYILYVSEDIGVAKVIGISSAIRTNDFGESVQREFKEIRGALRAKYGEPAKVFDYLRQGSKWDEPQYWTIGLLKQDRTLEAFWHVQGADISEYAAATSTESGYIAVSYEFPNFEVWQSKHKKKESAPF
jgi:hypothetical protein